jgi:hypothetical protein
MKFEIGDLVFAGFDVSNDKSFAIIEYVDERVVSVLMIPSGESTWFYHEEVELA